MSLLALYEVAAPAKLNLFLHVVGRRADGYHLLQSLFVLIDWCDTLHFELRHDSTLARHDLSAKLPTDDLCLRAARTLQAASGTALGADISIDKQVPWGAGMGGGSSDAASTLLALNRLWGLNWSRSRLLSLGLTLGADVPFFLRGHNAIAEGIGERLTPVTLPRQWLAVLKPAANIETRAIFARLLPVRSSEAATLESLSPNVQLEKLCAWTEPGFGRNDLQPPAEAECPQVAQAAAALRKAFGNSRMTGSGSAVFARAGLAAGAVDRPSVVMPVEITQTLAPGWVDRMCRSLVEHPLVGWAED